MDRTDTPIGIRRSSAYFPEIESLRGVAIALVFAVHLEIVVFGLAPREPSSSIWYAFVQTGQTGVDLFFLLSGFLLSLPFLKEAAGGPPVRWSDYFRRRALRVLPLYWFAVAVAVLLRTDELRDLARAIPYFFFLHSFPDTTTRLDPYSNVWWSLATEIQFYLLLPLLPLFLRSRRGRWWGVIVLLGYTVAYATFLAGVWRLPTHGGQRKLEQSVFGRAPLFLFGILVAWLHARFGERIRARLKAVRILAAGGADLLLFGVIAALGYLLRWTVSVGWYYLDLPPYHGWHVLEGFFWAAIVFLLLFAPLRSKPVLCNRFLCWLGVISYSLYLIHYPLLAHARLAMYRLGLLGAEGWTARGLAFSLFAAAASLAISALTYRTIERPFLARKARIDH